MGRLDSTREKINSEAEVLLSKNTYNEVGQLRSKGLHSTNNGTSYLATITYDYNERGWLKKQSSGQFTEELRYQDGSMPQYNGNISNQLWSTTGTIPASNPGTFTYQYDALNRLTSGVSTGTSPSMGEVLTYDVMGNIKTLKRDAGAVTTYNYTSGNRLTGTTGGLVTGTYVYNGNGNATTDGRTGMAFTYNYLDLPQTASKSGTSLTYLYDATGKKLRKTATAGSMTTQRDYIDGIEYNKIGTAATAIDIIHTPEGYALKNGSTFVYHYNLTDHLGNVRATIKKGTSALEVVQRDDYYPFGLEKVVLGGTNKYLYNGKELQSELGQYDYGARLYDPVIGRWNVVDAKAELYFQLSPYTHVANNPILLIDPNGMEIISIADGVRLTEEDAVNAFKVISGRTKNVYVDIEGNSKRRTSINAGKKFNSYGSWAVFSVENFTKANEALSIFDDKNLDNLVLETHGVQNSKGESLIQTDDIKNKNNSNKIFTSDINWVKGGHVLENVSMFKTILDKIMDGGRFILASCFVGQGEGGKAFAESINKLTGGRLNTYLPTNFIYALDVSTNIGPIRYINSDFKVDSNVGWLQIAPNGEFTNIRRLNLSTSTSQPVKIVK